MAIKEYEYMSTKKLIRLYNKNDKKLHKKIKEKNMLVNILNDLESEIYSYIMTDDCIERELRKREYE